MYFESVYKQGTNYLSTFSGAHKRPMEIINTYYERNTGPSLD